MKDYDKINRHLDAIKKESIEMLEAAKRAGNRELYAIAHGERRTRWINGHKCLVFEYSTKDKYQDANGATYDTVRKTWID